MQNKVVELNLETGRPTVDAAIAKLKNALSTYRMQGCKAVIVIHGYGSTGVGGSIKPAVKKFISEANMQGIIKASVGGEQWYFSKRSILNMCKSLESYENRIANNEGVTVIILK